MEFFKCFDFENTLLQVLLLIGASSGSIRCFLLTFSAALGSRVFYDVTLFRKNMEVIDEALSFLFHVLDILLGVFDGSFREHRGIDCVR